MNALPVKHRITANDGVWLPKDMEFGVHKKKIK